MAVSRRSQRLRRLLVRYRRPLAALCAFLSVLFALRTLAPSPEIQGAGRTGNTNGSSLSLAKLAADGLVAAPVRLADADVAALLEAGDLVDVLAADGNGRAAIVAPAASVVSIPAVRSDGLAAGSFGGALVVLAVTSSEATELAARSATGPLSIVLR